MQVGQYFSWIVFPCFFLARAAKKDSSILTEHSGRQDALAEMPLGLSSRNLLDTDRGRTGCEHCDGKRCGKAREESTVLRSS
jgi:hypothetical protein